MLGTTAAPCIAARCPNPYLVRLVTLVRGGAKERLMSSADLEYPVGEGTTGRCCSGRHPVTMSCPGPRAEAHVTL